MYVSPLLFFAQTSSQEFLQKNREFSELLANSFDQVWQKTFDSDLFVWLCFLGGVCGAIALSLFAYQWLQYQMGQRGYFDWSNIIIPFLLVLLLSKPPGQPVLLGKVLLGLRDISNDISTEILDSLSKELTASEAADLAATKTMMQLIATDAVKTCAAIPERDVRNACFFDAEAQIKKLVEQSIATYRSDPIVRLGSQLISKIQTAQGPDYATSQWFARLFGGLGSVYQGVSNFATPILFLNIGYAFYWILEVIAILTALTSPLFLGMSLYSFRYEPLLRNMSTFGGVWLAKLSYSIIIGFTGILMAETPSDPILLFPLIAGLFGPLLALGMGTGGGLGMFSVFTGVAAFSLKGR
ncbi:MAG: hypothetical protein QNJ32_28895 [Xenococcaceae cyanobacterium MO_167.B27]|nr:hypothetical protein [Xenococcaceae cyanobacterium MO_167.B27]